MKTRILTTTIALSLLPILHAQNNSPFQVTKSEAK